MSGLHRQPRRSRSEIREEQARKDNRSRLEKVVARMAVFDLMEHMDEVGSGMAKSLQDYRKDSDTVFHLLEIRRGLDELQVVIDELILRHEAAHDEN